MSVEIKGIDDVIQRFDDLANVEGLEQAMMKACALVEGAAKQNAPKDTGALIRSIESKVETNTDEIVGTVFTPLEYAPYVEFGTGKFAKKGGRKDIPWRYQDDKGDWHTTNGQEPQPFLRPALHDNRERIKTILKGGLND